MGYSERQEMQQQVLQEAYKPVINKAETVTSTQPEWKPDVFDSWYVTIRTVVPSWMMILIVIAGAGTVIFNLPWTRKLVTAILRGWGFEITRRSK